MNQKVLHIIGYASGFAAGNSGCKDGPRYFQKSPYIEKLNEQGIRVEFTKIFEPDFSLENKYHIAAKLNQALAEATYKLNKQHQKFVVLGGDHSSGIGTWSGIHAALQGDLGLIWIDAHLDAHTPETTPSGNIHGMPVASLLGYGDKLLTHIMNADPKIKPENLCIIGARSYEDGEQHLLEALGVKIYYSSEVHQRGLSEVFKEAHARVTKNTAGYGISIDLDGLDPVFAPGVGTPVNAGLHLDELCNELRTLPDFERCVGLEIAEYNPHECAQGLTEKAIYELLHAWCH